MVDITANGVRLLTFEDNQHMRNVGVLVNETEFIDISRALPEFPDKLADMIAIDDVAGKLKDALYYEDSFARLSYVRLTAPVCPERYLWLLAEGKTQKFLYLHAARGIVGHNAVLPAAFGSGLNFIPHIIFVCSKSVRQATAAQALGTLKGFTLMNLGLMTPEAAPNHAWRGLTAQFERFSAAGPWLMLYDSPAFFKSKRVRVGRNDQTLAEVDLERLPFKAAEVAAGLSETLTLLPGDMLALPLYPAFEVVQGDRLTLSMNGFGILQNIVATP